MPPQAPRRLARSEDDVACVNEVIGRPEIGARAAEENDADGAAATETVEEMDAQETAVEVAAATVGATTAEDTRATADVHV